MPSERLEQLKSRMMLCVTASPTMILHAKNSKKHFMIRCSQCAKSTGMKRNQAWVGIGSQAVSVEMRYSM